uniref:Hypoxia up-regulated protein 1 n=1 Tax=Macrostomum lignano TaxID=282301 RepID=A0A1I8HN27_9PLAT
AKKHPDQTFLHLPLLLGCQLNSPMVELYRQRYPHHRIVVGADGTLEFLLSGNLRLSVEQLSAMLLEAAIETAKTFIDDDVDNSTTRNGSKSEFEVAIATPPFWGQAERGAILRAAQYAGIPAARLVNNNAAVALNCGNSILSSLSSKPQSRTFFDFGASFTVSTAASYQKVTGSKNFQTYLLRILGTGYDPALGTFDFIERLINAGKSPVTMDASSVAKARVEAGQLFRVLSANRRAGSMTRDQLRTKVADLLNRLRRPVEMMTSLAGDVTRSSSSDTLLMGGGS